MASITICPRCTSHLELPPGASPAAQVQCPICEVEFSLATVAPRELPQARLLDIGEDVENIDEAANEVAADMSPQARLARLLHSSADLGASALSEKAHFAPPSADESGAEESDSPGSLISPSETTTVGASRLDQLLDDLIESPAAAPQIAEYPQQRSERDEFEPDFSAEYETDDQEEEEVVLAPIGPAASGDHEPLDPRTAPRRKQSASGLRTLVGVIGGGALGLLLGAYGLLWLKGPAGDIAGLSQWLPPAMLPASMRSMADAEDDAPAASVKRSELTIVNEPPKLDTAVVPATATEPVLADPPPRDGAAPPVAQSSSPLVADLRSVKLYSVAELAELLDDADAARSQFLTGDLARQESWATMGPAYITLAALAERFTLIDSAERSDELAGEQNAAKDVFHGMAGDPARRADLATIAARWLQHERRQNNGVVLIGRVRDLRPSGKWIEYVIDVPLGESTVAANVLMDGASFATGDEVAVVGAILPRPQEQLAGYQGDATQLVVAGYAFAPEEFVAPQPTADAGLQAFGAGAAAE